MTGTITASGLYESNTCNSANANATAVPGVGAGLGESAIGLGLGLLAETAPLAQFPKRPGNDGNSAGSWSRLPRGGVDGLPSSRISVGGAGRFLDWTPSGDVAIAPPPAATTGLGYLNRKLGL